MTTLILRKLFSLLLILSVSGCDLIDFGNVESVTAKAATSSENSDSSLDLTEIDDAGGEQLLRNAPFLDLPMLATLMLIESKLSLISPVFFLTPLRPPNA